jgi:ankyrin repeat protein
MFAITTTDYDLVKVLLDHGADPNMTDKVNVIVVTPEMQNLLSLQNKRNALIQACYWNSEEVSRLVVERGCQINAIDYVRLLHRHL